VWPLLPGITVYRCMEPQSQGPVIVRYSEEVLRQERRKSRTYGVFGIIAALCGLSLSYAGYRGHRWIDVGPMNQTFLVPPWAAALISILWLAGSLFLLFKARPAHRSKLG
jgi:hypothetical protein